MNECDDIQPKLSAMLDGELSLDELGRAEAHVAGCLDCQTVLASYHTLRKTVAASTLPDLEDRWSRTLATVFDLIPTDMTEEIRALRGEIAALRGEVAALRREIVEQPARLPSRTALSLSDLRVRSLDRYRLV